MILKLTIIDGTHTYLNFRHVKAFATRWPEDRPVTHIYLLEDPNENPTCVLQTPDQIMDMLNARDLDRTRARCG